MIIHTFDSRNLILWGVMQEYFSLNDIQMNKIIKESYDSMLIQLKKNNIDYDNLRKMLTPQNDRKEICLVFDTSNIESRWYGLDVFKKYFPLIDDIDKICIFEGDLIGPAGSQENVKRMLNESIVEVNKSIYISSVQYYLIYINNLSKKNFEKIVSGVSSIKEIYGYIDTTYYSQIKDLISACIGQRYFKYKKYIVMEMSDIEEVEVNNSFYPFEKYGYICKYIKQTEYSSFLCYKIQRSYYNFDEKDQILSINTITPEVKRLKEFEIIIDDDKIEYLRKEKFYNYGAIGLDVIKKSDLIKIIKYLYNTNYIFNIEFKEQFDVYKFNINIDFQLEKERYKRFILAFEYKYKEKELRLITMY